MDDPERPPEAEGEEMKKLIGLITFALAVSASSFAAEHLVSHSAKFLGKQSYKVIKAPVTDFGKGGDKLLKFVF